MPSYVEEESLGSVRVFWLDQEKLLKEIREVALRIGESEPDVRKIILFGSLAEKRAVPGSDADILVVLEKSEKSFGERVSEWSGRFPVDFPVEVFPCTVAELSSPLAQEAVRKGMVLFARGE